MQHYVAGLILLPMYLIFEKKQFFSVKSGATKTSRGFWEEGLNGLMARTSMFGQNGWPRSLICILSDFDPLCWSIRNPLLGFF